MFGSTSIDSTLFDANALNQSQLSALRSHLTHYEDRTGLSSMLAQSKTYMVIVDTGASSTSTPDITDFIPGTYKKMTGCTMKGIAQSLIIEREGKVEYQLIDS